MNYGNAADFVSYHEDRGRDIPGSWSDTGISAALLVASEWLDASYADSWVGYPTGGYSQERLWPRSAAYTNTSPSYTFTDDEIPLAVVSATYEAAYRELTTPGTLGADFTPGKYKSVKIDGAVQVEYASMFSAGEAQIQMPVLAGLMNPLLTTGIGKASPISGDAVRVK